MTTVGQILSQSRNHKKLTLEQVEKATKIRLKFLVALEKDEFNKLPPGTFARGFIKNYASYLGLSGEEMLAFYRRQTNEEKAPAMPNKPVPKPGFSVSPINIGIAILIILFFLYLSFSYFRFAGAPALNVSYPLVNAIVATEQIEVTGKTDPDALVSINNQTVAVNENGTFTTKLILAPGLNTITIVASNKFSRQTTVTRNLRLEK